MNDVIFTRIVSSQKRIFESTLPKESLTSFTALQNESFSFSLAYRSLLKKNEGWLDTDMPISVVVTSTLPVSVYKIVSVPYGADNCDDASKEEKGDCPDILIERAPAPEIIRLDGDWRIPYTEKDEKVALNASCNKTQGVYVTVNKDGALVPAGEHTVCVRVISLMSGEEIARHDVAVHIIGATLPKNDLIYTNWFHYDCLADESGLEIWSDAYFDLLGKYIKNATTHGINTLLTPAFTPALDTPIGLERMNVQLVRVTKDEKGYSFDFSLFERFVKVAKENGIEIFEHCHLFSQWGSKTAINVYGSVNGNTVRLFGRETPATDPEYVRFLREYLSEFLCFAEKTGIKDNLLFHISDEPLREEKEYYASALDIVKDVLKGQKIGDALSDYEFYRQGLGDLPIAHISKADDFYGKCDAFMLYNTGGEPFAGNRFINKPPWHIRSLGMQLFRYRAKGFLHWAYNNVYGKMSQGVCNPAIEPCFYKNMPGLTSIVYPGLRCLPMPSLREKQFGEAMNDYRAMKLLESLTDYDAVMAVCFEVFGNIEVNTVPESEEQMLRLRQRINEEIEKRLTSRH